MTLAAQVTDAGISAPDYQDIMQQLVIAIKQIYGSDVNLDPDTQDGEFLAIFAQAMSDCNQVVMDVFNSFSPTTARGAALSRLVKLNGLARNVSSNSTLTVDVGGTVGTQINNGIVIDTIDQQWALPPLVTIPISGTISVTATALLPGAVSTPAHTVSIFTPTLGWQTADNQAAAVTGNPVETDPELRLRQSNSVAIPALTVLEGIYAAIAAVAGVQDLAVYENSTDITDANGIPRHTISAVVSGGDVALVAAAIAEKKSPGVGTYGTTSQTIIDENGVPNVINFYQLSQIVLTMAIQIHPLTGYVSTTGVALKQAVADFVNGLLIGEDSYLNRLFSPANMGGVGLGATYVVTAITQSRGGPLLAADIVMAFNEGASLIPANITLTTV